VSPPAVPGRRAAAGEDAVSGGDPPKTRGRAKPRKSSPNDDPRYPPKTRKGSAPVGAQRSRAMDPMRRARLSPPDPLDVPAKASAKKPGALEKRTHVVTSERELVATRKKAMPGDRIVKDYDLKPGEVKTEVVRAPGGSRRRKEAMFNRQAAHFARRANAKKHASPTSAGVPDPRAFGPLIATRTVNPRKIKQHWKNVEKQLDAVGKRVVSRATAQQRGTRTAEARAAKTARRSG
jgi:hypothetical protein